MADHLDFNKTRKNDKKCVLEDHPLLGEV